MQALTIKMFVMVCLFFRFSFGLAFATEYVYSPQGYVEGDVIKVQVTNLIGSHIYYEVRKISGTFVLGGTMEMRESSPSGPACDSTAYSAGASSVSLDCWETHTTGTVSYYAVVASDPNQYWAGPINIQARLDVPTIYSPNNGETNLENPVLFDWNTNVLADNYRIQISTSTAGWNDEDGFVSTELNTTTTQDYYSWSGAQLATTYYWSIRAGSYSDTYHSRYTVPRQFSIRLSSPILQIPNNGETNLSNSVYFDWTGGTGAQNYRIQVATSMAGWDNENGFQYPEVNIQTTPSNYTWDNAQLGTTYYWSIRSGSSVYYHSKYATPRTFSTRLATPVPTVPNDGATGVAIPIDFDWNDVFNADDYRIEIATSISGWTAENGFVTTVEALSGLTGSDYSWSGALSNTTYYWSVRSGSGTYYHSEFSYPRSFTTGEPDLIFPLATSTILNPADVTFQWSNFSPGYEYILKIRDVTDDPVNGPIVFHHNCGYALSWPVQFLLKPDRDYRWTAYSAVHDPQAITFSTGFGIIETWVLPYLSDSSTPIELGLTACGNVGNINAFAYIFDESYVLMNPGNEHLTYIGPNPHEFSKSYYLPPGEYEVQYKVFDEANPSNVIWYPSQTTYLPGPKIEDFVDSHIYKIGVCYFLSNPATASSDLDDIINEVGHGDTFFSDGTTTVYLVVQTEISWADTEPSYGSYDFSNFINFAELCKMKGIKWTPLLSYHYMPSWLVSQTISDYGNDPRLRTYDNTVSSGNFMPYAPSSPVYNDYAASWTIQALNALVPYFGTVIDEVFIGNEMMYSSDVLTTYDPYSQAAWKAKYGSLNDMPDTLTDDFKQFRFDEWRTMLTSLLTTARSVTDLYNINASTKFVAYYLHPTQVQTEPNFGVNLPSAERIMHSMQYIGDDQYPPNPTWYQILPYSTKPMYMAEFNKPAFDVPPYATQVEVENWINTAIPYNFRYFTMFCWNPNMPDDWQYEIQQEHKDALYNIIQSLVSSPFQVDIRVEPVSLVIEQSAGKGFSIDNNEETAEIDRIRELDKQSLDRTLNDVFDSDYNSYIPVIISLRQRLNPRYLQNTYERWPKQKRRSGVTKELKSFHQKSAQSLLALLRKNELEGNVRQISSLWLTNSISVELKSDLLYMLQARNDIALIRYDEAMFRGFQNETTGSIPPQFTAEWGLEKINADNVWSEGYSGDSIVVAVIDGGVNYNHQDLLDHMWDGLPSFPNHGYDFIAGDNDPMDEGYLSGHGTHVAGIIAGDGTSGIQTGVAPDATIMALRVFDDFLTTGISDIENAVQFSLDNGADVVNFSGGLSYYDAVCDFYMIPDQDRIDMRDIANTLLAAGIVWVVATGNDATCPGATPPLLVSTPSDVPSPWYGSAGNSSVIAVGAMTQSDTIAAFSNYGPVFWEIAPPYNDYPGPTGLMKPNLAAPGVDIFSLNYNSTTGYRYKDGTSQAAPFVSGTIALMLEKNPALTPEEIDNILYQTATDIESPGPDNYSGAGLVNAYAAVSAVAAVTGGTFTINNDGQGLLRITAITSDEDWVSATQNEFTIQPLSSKNVDALINWNMLGTSQVIGHLTVHSNDVDTPQVVVTVTAIPDLPIPPEVSGNQAYQMQLVKNGQNIDFLFEDVAATSYNIYVSTSPATSSSQPFSLEGDVGEKHCDITVTNDLGDMLEIIDFDPSIGIGSSWNCLYFIISADNGTGTEGSLGTSTLVPDNERYAQNYCHR